MMPPSRIDARNTSIDVIRYPGTVHPTFCAGFQIPTGPWRNLLIGDICW